MRAPLALVIAAGTLLAPVGAPPTSAAGGGSHLRPALVEHLADVTADTSVRVIAQGGPAARDAVRRAGLRLETTLERVGLVVASGTPGQVEALGQDPAITRVDWADEPVVETAVRDQEATRATAVHGGAVDADRDGRLDRLTGRGTTIAVVDGGVDGTHPIFRAADGSSRVRRSVMVTCVDEVAAILGSDVDDCVVDRPDNNTDTTALAGHGTHVAGIAAGGLVTDASGRRIRGSAPEADVVAVGAGATFTMYGGVLGMAWVLEHHADPCGDGSCPPVVVLNNSWLPGSVPGASTDFDPTAPTAVVGRALVRAGVTVVWGAGNNGGDGATSTTSPTAKDPTPGILMVGAYDDGGTGARDNVVASVSSVGLRSDPLSYPDLVAPGANVTSSCRAYLPICATGTDSEDPDYSTLTGTSMAAPHVAGYVAVVQQAAQRRLGRLLTPAEVEDLLVDTAHRFGTRTWVRDSRNPDATSLTSYDAGHGLVDVLAAVRRIARDLPPRVRSVRVGPRGSRFVVGRRVFTVVRATDADGDRLRYRYSWGDGRTTTSSRSVASHVWRHPGRFRLVVRVGDGVTVVRRTTTVTITRR